MTQPSRDSGYTLIEVLVVISLMSVMMAIAVGGWNRWAQASSQSGQARELQSVLRQAQQRAITEGQAICIDFREAQNDYTVYRGACDSASRQSVSGPIATDSADVHLVTPSFTAPSGPATGVTFNARGTAWPGSVKVARDGSSKVYTLSVDGLTGRVSLT